jgi:hypothetical protein
MSDPNVNDPAPVFAHGTGTGYREQHCRCRACLDWEAARQRRKRANRRARRHPAGVVHASQVPALSPVAGPLFRAAAAVPVDGTKRHRLLCLLAAYADGGEHSPPVRALAARLGFDDAHGLDALLRALERDGHLRVRWRAGRGGRNVYELRIEERGKGASVG